MDVRPAPGTPGPDGNIGVATCYRHPGRPTYLSCSRCGRPACPDCLRPAPVGQHCLDCIRDGNRGMRGTGMPARGRAVSGAPATWVLVGLNVAFYLAEWAYPAIVGRLDMLGAGVASGEPYRLISGAFLHEPGFSGFGPAHILFNMWALYLVGPPLERLLGHTKFLAVYLLSALGGSALFYLLASPWEGSLGASGAIFGLFGAWFVVARRLRVDSRGVLFLIVINLAITFAVPAIAWQAHVGGLAAGALLTGAYVYAPRRVRVPVQAAATLAIAAVIAAMVVSRTLALTGGVLG